MNENATQSDDALRIIGNGNKCIPENPTLSIGKTEQDLSDECLFSSEPYKLRLDSLPKYIGIGQLKKQFAKRHVKPVKIKKSPQWEFAYITFRVSSQ